MTNPIKTIRTSLNLTQEEFGDLINEKQSNISRWERGANITWQKVMRICEMLKFEKNNLFS